MQNVRQISSLFALFTAGAIGAFLLSVGLFVNADGMPCHLLDKSSTPPRGYGAAYNALTSAKELLVAVSCSQGSVTVGAGNGSSQQVVYKEGYEYKNGAWRAYTLTGDPNKLLGNAWWQGVAVANLPRTAAELEQTNYVVAYVCTWTNNQWKCGCRDSACSKSHWQLQSFKKSQGVSNVLPNVFTDAYSDILVVGYPSQYYGPAGTKVIVYGLGFEPNGNTVYLGPTRKIENLSTSAHSQLEFTIPSDMQAGMYRLYVGNSKGKSEQHTFFIVTRPGTTPPKVTSVSPTAGKSGSRVTIQGSGFLPTGNVIQTSFASITDIPSPDGKTLTFTLTVLPEFPNLHKSDSPWKGQKMDVYMHVINENGISPDPVKFNAEF